MWAKYGDCLLISLVCRSVISFVVVLVWMLCCVRPTYRQTANISSTKTRNVNISRLVLLSLPNPLKPDVKSRLKIFPDGPNDDPMNLAARVVGADVDPVNGHAKDTCFVVAVFVFLSLFFRFFSLTHAFVSLATFSRVQISVNLFQTYEDIMYQND